MPVLVFDLNETLLDLRGLDPVFERIFGDSRIRGVWFQQVLQSAMTLTITGSYRDFTEIGAAALRMVGQRYGVKVQGHETRRVEGALCNLPPHSEVEGALEGLQRAGYRLAVLTNSPLQVMREQLSRSGLGPYFPDRISVEEGRALKPAPAVYRAATNRLGVAPETMLMIAAHGWDLAGAFAAGCRTAFVGRSGQVLEGLFPEPDLQGSDLQELASRIRERFG